MLSNRLYLARSGDKAAVRSVRKTDSTPVRSSIVAHFRQVAKEQRKKLAPLSEDLILLDSGLDSLCFAIIVARLEDEYGTDPFGAGERVEFPVTLGDFIQIYEDAAQ